jgi:hypothetical protein
MHLILMVSTPMESLETPWGVSNCWVSCKGEKQWHCTPFLSTQCWQLLYMYCRDQIYIMFFSFYNVCEIQVRIAVG